MRIALWKYCCAALRLLGLAGLVVTCWQPRLVGESEARSRHGSRPSVPHPPKLPEDVLRVPLIGQVRSYSCGPAALLGVLRYYQMFSGPESALYKPLGTHPDEGTLPEALAQTARSFGLLATVEQPMTLDGLRTALAEKKTVILELQAWAGSATRTRRWSKIWDDGHYVVLIGMDDYYLYFMDPSTGDAYTYLPIRELAARWHDVNGIRTDPKLHRDYQLGIVISRPAEVAVPRVIPKPVKPPGKTKGATAAATQVPRVTAPEPPAPPLVSPPLTTHRLLRLD